MENEKQFRAGAAVANISPWMGLSIEGNMHDHKGTNLHDQLHARCLALDNGQTRLDVVQQADQLQAPKAREPEVRQHHVERRGPSASQTVIAASAVGHLEPGVFEHQPQIRGQA